MTQYCYKKHAEEKKKTRGSSKVGEGDTSESLEGFDGHDVKPGFYTKDREKPQEFKERDDI